MAARTHREKYRLKYTDHYEFAVFDIPDIVLDRIVRVEQYRNVDISSASKSTSLTSSVSKMEVIISKPPRQL